MTRDELDEDSENYSKFDGPIGIVPAGGCKQCKACCFQHPDPENAWDHDYLKAICMIYTPERGMKPEAVMDDTEPCEYFDSMAELLANYPD